MVVLYGSIKLETDSTFILLYKQWKRLVYGFMKFNAILQQGNNSIQSLNFQKGKCPLQ